MEDMVAECNGKNKEPDPLSRDGMLLLELGIGLTAYKWHDRPTNLHGEVFHESLGAQPMHESPELPAHPGRIPSVSTWVAHGAYGAMIATSVALVVFVVIGNFSWATVRGYQGIGICGALAAVVGIAPRAAGSRLARVLGGGIGGAVAGYFAVAAGELFPPRTVQWVIAGAADGAAVPRWSRPGRQAGPVSALRISPRRVGRDHR
jgi:hypothetical protein